MDTVTHQISKKHSLFVFLALTKGSSETPSKYSIKITFEKEETQA